MNVLLFCKKYAHIICIAAFAVIIAAGGMIVIKGSHGNVVINEVCSSNVACVMDANGDYPDWIEIYNPTNEPVDLSGFIVNKSSDLKKEKYVIPDGVLLGPGSFFLFDPGFSISAEGARINLLDKKRQYVDSVQVPGLKYDTTYARSSDGSLGWSIRTATPGYSNADGEELPAVLDGGVTASQGSGFYDKEFELKLRSTNWGRKVYYTLDGSDPRVNGILYEDPLIIKDRSDDANVYSAIPYVSPEYIEGRKELPSFAVDKCTVVRAVATDLLGRFTDIDTFTYFVGFDEKSAYDNMTVVSVSADPDDLFSSERGIMVIGDEYSEDVDDSANYDKRGRSFEREMTIDVFDTDHAPVLEKRAGIRIKGGDTREDVQKSFGVIFRTAYGGRYKESFTTDGYDFDLHSLAIDKCGQDSGTKMKDAIMDRCMADSGCLTKRTVPCCLFLNGEYWGFYWLSERFDRSLVADRYGVDKDDVEYVTGYDFESASDWSMENFDRDSLIEYYAANIITAHENDWPGSNVKFWRTAADDGTPYGDGKLRPVIFDMNSTSMVDKEYDGIAFMLEKYYPFVQFTEDDEYFRSDLADKIDEMGSNEFEQGKVLGLIDELYGRIHDQMILDRMRYENCSREAAQRSFDANVDEIRDFYKDRWQYLDKYKEAYLNGN